MSFCSLFLVTASRRRARAWDTAARLCVRTVLCGPAFSLVPPLGSPGSAAARAALFARFVATMGGSDFSTPCIVGYGLRPSRRGPSLGWPGRRWRSPGSRAEGLRACQVLRRRGVTGRLALATPGTWPSAGRRASAPRSWFTPLDGWPTRTPVNASRQASRPAVHELGASVVRYAFTVEDFHLLPPAGLPAHPSTPSDPGARPHPARAADQEGPAGDHDPRLRAQRHHHAVRRAQRARRHGASAAACSATAIRSSSASSTPIERAVPAGKLIHAILDNYATHKHPKVLRLARPPSALDLPLHADLVLVAERRRELLLDAHPAAAQRGVFRSIVDLQAAINRFVAEHNDDPKPFAWTKTADPDPRQTRSSRMRLCTSGSSLTEAPGAGAMVGWGHAPKGSRSK